MRTYSIELETGTVESSESPILISASSYAAAVCKAMRKLKVRPDKLGRWFRLFVERVR